MYGTKEMFEFFFSVCSDQYTFVINQIITQNSSSICGTSDLDSNRSQMGSPPPPLAPRVAHPKEFEILPESGILQPQSEVRVNNRHCKYRARVMVFSATFNNISHCKYIVAWKFILL
jgi:hypothetical protein